MGRVVKGSRKAVVRLRHHEHVALVDGLPAADARAVEAQAVFEHVLRQLADRNGEVLPQAGKVHEPQVDRLDFFFAAQGQDFLGSDLVAFIPEHGENSLPRVGIGPHGGPRRGPLRREERESS